jgi:hypothetical protein
MEKYQKYSVVNASKEKKCLPEDINGMQFGFQWNPFSSKIIYNQCCEERNLKM